MNRIRRLKLWIKKHKKISLVISLFILIILTVSGTKIFLFFNLLLGNDTIVTLEVDKQDLFILHGQEEEIEFKTKVTANPFCNILCESEFIDISKGEIITKDGFSLRSTIPLEKKFVIKPETNGEGMDLYRFDIECYSEKSLLCHTEGEPSTRSILITARYGLNEEEKLLKLQLEKDIEEINREFLNFYEVNHNFEETSKKFNNTLIMNNEKKELENLNRTLNNLENLWNNQDYYSLETEIQNAKKQFEIEKKYFDDLNSSLYNTTERYNSIVKQIFSTKDKLEGLKELILLNETNIEKFNKVTGNFNDILLSFEKRSTIGEKEELIKKFEKESGIDLLVTKTKKEILRKELELDIYYDLLCGLSNICIEHQLIDERAEQEEFSLNELCSKIEGLEKELSKLNESIKESVDEYPNSDDFWGGIKNKIFNMKQEKISEYLEKLPENKTNTDLIREIIYKQPSLEIEEYPEYDLKNALIFELIKQKPENCVFLGIKPKEIEYINIELIRIEENKSFFPAFSLEEPEPQCCVFNTCEPCCLTEECRSDKSNFPVIFLHGHAIDKEVSAEYSLEGFNKIQKRLEEDGYLNAGIITLYTEKDSPNGLWGWPKVPLTIRTSYYFDVFKHPENYIVVQTKSENIDAYSIRLKEIVDIVKYKTGKPKVNIIAFSMGGLVARRYIQIFGENDVEKLIMIGTPNKGIVGQIADYCPITGEKLECRDMNSDSLFINKLNSDPPPKLNIYNIIGTGCNIKEGKGDGAVLEEKAFLEGAENYMINGTCKSKTRPLHLELRDIDLYPEVYGIIKESLENN